MRQNSGSPVALHVEKALFSRMAGGHGVHGQQTALILTLLCMCILQPVTSMSESVGLFPHVCPNTLACVVMKFNRILCKLWDIMCHGVTLESILSNFFF